MTRRSIVLGTLVATLFLAFLANLGAGAVAIAPSQVVREPPRLIPVAPIRCASTPIARTTAPAATPI